MAVIIVTLIVVQMVLAVIAPYLGMMLFVVIVLVVGERLYRKHRNW